MRLAYKKLTDNRQTCPLDTRACGAMIVVPDGEALGSHPRPATLPPLPQGGRTMNQTTTHDVPLVRMTTHDVPLVPWLVRLLVQDDGDLRPAAAALLDAAVLAGMAEPE